MSFVQREIHRVGIFAFHDVEELIAMNVLLGAGVDLLGKAVLVRFDNTFISQKMIPGIISADQHIDEMCQIAIKELLGQMYHDGKNKIINHRKGPVKGMPGSFFNWFFVTSIKN